LEDQITIGASGAVPREKAGETGGGWQQSATTRSLEERRGEC
jgi:hypothetical protein